MSITVEKLKALLEKDENSKLDFKREVQLNNSNQKKEFVKDVCAIANYLFSHSGKGHIVLGYDKKTNKIVGINPRSYQESKIQLIISSNSDPSPLCSISFVPIDEKTLGVITLSKNYNGPHQVKRLGFPIRRGSITELLSTDEVYNLMLKRQSYRKDKENEYEILSGTSRIKAIYNDVISVLSELDLSNVDIIDYKGVNRIHYPCKFVTFRRIINDSECLFLLSIHPKGEKNDLWRFEFTINGLFKSEEVINPIFINIYPSTVKSPFFNNLLKQHTTLTKIKLKPTITYFGLGRGFDKNRISPHTYNLPKIYVSKINSKRNIKNNLEIIMNWIDDHNELINEIHNFWNASISDIST